jgi:hypothetical protein
MIYKYFDFASNEDKILEYPPESIFTVYVRRSNCSKRLLYTGKDPAKALSMYYQTRAYIRDRKYLYVNNKKTLMENGTREKLHGRSKPYNAKNFQSVPVMTPRLPVTVVHKLKTLRRMEIQGIGFSIAKIINLTLSRVAEMEKDEALNFLNTCLVCLRKHEVLSGLDNHPDATTQLEEEML